MGTILKIIGAIILAIILIVSGYYIYSLSDEEDTEPPVINEVTGDTTAQQGVLVDIAVNFSDNKNVTIATIYYKSETADSWSNASILSGTYSLFIPNEPDDWYYYIVIDDKKGNGPIGDPSTDGSEYYTITVEENSGNGNGEDLVHTVFIEETSATDCKYCPYAAEKIHELYESGDYRFYYVSLVEDQSDLAESRMKDEYNIEGNPWVFIDGGYRAFFSGLTEISEYSNAIREAEQRSVPKIFVNITSSYDNNTDLIQSTVYVHNYEESQYTGRLRVYLTEKVSRWNDYNGSKYHFGFLDYVINQDISISSDEGKYFNESYDASDLDPDNIMLIAVVFSSESKQGYTNPDAQENPFNAYYADACAASEVVEGGNLPPEVGITFPQPGNAYYRGNIRFNILTFIKKSISKTTTLTNTFILGPTTITAYADDDSSVEKVEFYINDELVFNDTEAPYEFAPQGKTIKNPFIFPKKYEITVKAIDDEGKESVATMDVIAWRAFVY